MVTSGRPRFVLLVVVVTLSAVMAACGGSAAHPAALPKVGPSPDVSAATAATTATSAATTTAPGSTVPATTSTQPRPSTTTSPPSPTSVAAVPAASGSFVGTEATITAADVPYTWRAGCPVGPAQLRMLHLSYWGFDNKAHIGTMVVNASVVANVFKVFSTLFSEHFPIFQMQPEDAYHGSDPASMAADNTSGFNCRDAVAPGPPQWSVHAYGEAIDVNTVQNPYLEGNVVMPTAGAQYLNRSDDRPGMAVPGGQLVEAFASVGWLWGGRWTASPDYQHFSKTGG